MFTDQSILPQSSSVAPTQPKIDTPNAERQQDSGVLEPEQSVFHEEHEERKRDDTKVASKEEADQEVARVDELSVADHAEIASSLSHKERQLEFTPKKRNLLLNGSHVIPFAQILGRGKHGEVKGYGGGLVIKAPHKTSPGHVKSLKREAAIAHAVLGPVFGVVTFHEGDNKNSEHGAGEKSLQHNTPFIAMPALPQATDSQEFLNRKLETVKQTGGGFLAGLKILTRFNYALLIGLVELVHNKGIIHGDIKIDNFVFATLEKEEPIAVPIDFGLSCTVGEVRGKLLVSQTKTIKHYAPEMFGDGEIEADYSQDIFSLGIGYIYLLIKLIHRVNSENKCIPIWLDFANDLFSNLSASSNNKEFQKTRIQGHSCKSNSTECLHLVEYMNLALLMCHHEPAQRASTSHIFNRLSEIIKSVHAETVATSALNSGHSCESVRYQPHRLIQSSPSVRAGRMFDAAPQSSQSSESSDGSFNSPPVISRFVARSRCLPIG